MNLSELNNGQRARAGLILAELEADGFRRNAGPGGRVAVAEYYESGRFTVEVRADRVTGPAPFDLIYRVELYFDSESVPGARTVDTTAETVCGVARRLVRAGRSDPLVDAFEGG